MSALRDVDILDLTSESDTHRKLVEAFTSSPKRPVIASIVGLSGATKDRFARRHVYSVTDFDPDGPDGGTVTIRNPLGGFDNSPSGTIKISLKQFHKNFFCVAYSQG